MLDVESDVGVVIEAGAFFAPAQSKDLWLLFSPLNLDFRLLP